MRQRTPFCMCSFETNPAIHAAGGLETMMQHIRDYDNEYVSMVAVSRCFVVHMVESIENLISILGLLRRLTALSGGRPLSDVADG